MQSFIKVSPDFARDCERLTRDEMRVFLHLSMIMQFESNAILWELDLRDQVAITLKMTVRSLKLFVYRLIKKGFVFQNGFWLVLNSQYVKKGK